MKSLDVTSTIFKLHNTKVSVVLPIRQTEQYVHHMHTMYYLTKQLYNETTGIRDSQLNCLWVEKIN